MITGMRRWAWLGALPGLVLLLTTPASGAAKAEDLTEKLEQANNRIRVLEAKYKSVIERLTQVEGASAKATVSKAELQKLLNRMEKETRGKPVWHSAFDNLTLSLYGYIKADAAYTTHRTSNVNSTMYVGKEPSGANNDDEFGMTVKQTRLGLKVKSGEPTLGAETTGIIEVDFYGSGAENKPELMLRKAYIDMYWPESDTRFIAGQTFEIISPLNPDTVDYPVLWLGGNVGYRRPMFALSKGIELADDTKLILQGAIARGTSLSDTPAGIDEARDAGWPIIEGRAALRFPGWVDGAPVMVGVSGHIGEDEVDMDPANDGSGRQYATWSVCTDLTLPLADWLLLKGETFVGDNLDAFLGGIGQGVDLGQDTEIRSVGGWMQLTVYPVVLATGDVSQKDVWLNFGYGVDDPSDDDLSDGRRSRNEVLFANIWYRLSRQVTVGAEVSYWETSYKNDSAGDAVRLQSAVKYAF